MDVSHLPAAAFAAREFNVRFSVNVGVLSAHVAIACQANAALSRTHTHTHTERENGKAGTLAQLVLRLGSGVAAERKLTSAFFPPPSPYEAGDGAVHLQNALGAAVTLVGLSVRAEPGALASPRLVTCEASFTSSAAEGALQRTAWLSEKKQRGEKTTRHVGPTMVLWHSELAVQPPFSGGPMHSSMSSHTWE